MNHGLSRQRRFDLNKKTFSDDIVWPAKHMKIRVFEIVLYILEDFKYKNTSIEIVLTEPLKATETIWNIKIINEFHSHILFEYFYSMHQNISFFYVATDCA